MKPIRIVLADDNATVRTGLRAVFKRAGIEVVGEAVDGLEAIDQSQRLNPDVLVLDLSMPHMNGIEAIRVLRTFKPPVPILVLSVYDRPEFAAECARLNVAGYLLKEEPVPTIIQAVESIARGERNIFSSRLAPHLSTLDNSLVE